MLQGRATSPSCWSSGRAIRTARSTTRATASTRWRPASTARPRSPAIRNADDDLAAPARGARRARTGRRHRHRRHRRPRLLHHLEGRARPARRPSRATPTCRRASCRPASWRIDLAQALGLPLFDPDDGYAVGRAGQPPKRGNGLIGGDPAHPDVVVAANGGSTWSICRTATRRWRRGWSRRCSPGLRQRPVRRRRARRDPRAPCR